jgi:hypothetical protein
MSSYHYTAVMVPSAKTLESWNAKVIGHVGVDDVRAEEDSKENCWYGFY